MTFVDRHGLWSDAQQEAAREAARRIEAEGLETVRLSFPDLHGILRGKTLVASEAVKALRDGATITTTMLAKDTSHKTVFPVFTPGGGFGLPEMGGGADVLMVPDPTTFRILPWADKAGHVLCDLHFPDGRPVPFATRRVLKDALARLAGRGLAFVAGLEVEFHVFKRETARIDLAEAGQPGTPPAVSLLSRGYQHLTEARYDALEPALDLVRRAATGLGLPVRSVEIEYGPSQCEFTFAPTVGLDPADAMVLFRSAAKQVCARHGLHATFMCRPLIPQVMSSGWHLHQSLRDGEGANAFMAEARAAEPLSPLGLGYLAGILAHARAAAVFTTPTLNGYKRFRSLSLAPDRAVWGRDNRGVMIRVLGGPGDGATRLENRVGEPAANPYLFMASQILAGLDGIDRGLDPGPSADAPYEAAVPLLPKSLRAAVEALDADPFFRDALGEAVVHWILRIKRAEIERFEAEVTEWEHREYFETF